MVGVEAKPHLTTSIPQPMRRAHHQLLYHVAGHAGILAYDYLVALAVGLRFALGESGGISSRKFDNIDGGKGASRGASDGSANTGNGFNKSHY